MGHLNRTWSYRLSLHRGLRLQAQLSLLLLDLVSLRPGGGSVLGLDLCPLGPQAGADLVLGVVAAADGLVHEALGVALFEGGDDFLARCN